MLLLVEHEPVITLGTRGSTANIISTLEELGLDGIQIHQVERGGDVTYHGPGQVVGYPIIHLTQRKLSLRTYVHMLEETIIQTLEDFDIRAGRAPQHRGVWVEDLKVAALGVAIRRWVSFHGFALNVSPNLDHYCHINPCDLAHEQVTSMASLLGEPVGMAEVTKKLLSTFIGLFPGEWQTLTADQLLGEIEIDEEISQTRGMQG
jgi:lipoate-protein ligase B